MAGRDQAKAEAIRAQDERQRRRDRDRAPDRRDRRPARHDAASTSCGAAVRRPATEPPVLRRRHDLRRHRRGRGDRRAGRRSGPVADDRAARRLRARRGRASRASSRTRAGSAPSPGPWIMGQYAGFGTATETNGRFRALLDAGVTGFSVALDLPTQMGIDSDDPRGRRARSARSAWRSTAWPTSRR